MELISELRFQSEEEAYRYVECCIWPRGAICPRCGEMKRVGRLKGLSTRIGTYKCYRCRKPFTVKINSVFEASHVLMHVWLKAIFLIGLSRRSIEARDLVRILEVSPRTAEYLLARIRRAVRHREPVHACQQSFEHMEALSWNQAKPASANALPARPQTQAARRPQRGACENSWSPPRHSTVNQARPSFETSFVQSPIRSWATQRTIVRSRPAAAAPTPAPPSRPDRAGST
jgi:transposase-like protein